MDEFKCALSAFLATIMRLLGVILCKLVREAFRSGKDWEGVACDVRYLEGNFCGCGLPAPLIFSCC
jgi:hypothetical protein